MVISQSTTEIRGLAVDWIGRRLYVTDATSRVVRVMTYDGKRKKQVIRDEVYSPQAVTVDAVHRSVQQYNTTEKEWEKNHVCLCVPCGALAGSDPSGLISV